MPLMRVVWGVLRLCRRSDCIGLYPVRFLRPYCVATVASRGFFALALPCAGVSILLLSLGISQVSELAFPCAQVSSPLTAVSYHPFNSSFCIYGARAYKLRGNTSTQSRENHAHTEYMPLKGARKCNTKIKV